MLIAITSGISMIPALRAWIESPDPGIGHEHDDVGDTGDLDLCLPHPDRLDDDDILARGVEKQHRLQRRLGQARRRAPASPSSG